MCDKRFAHNFLVYRHERDEHHTVMKKVTCDICSQKFYSEDQLKRHIIDEQYVSDVSTRLQCNLCDKTFVDDSNLNSHGKERHKDNQPYPCDQCNMVFKRKYPLLRHKRVTHDGQVKGASNLCVICVNRNFQQEKYCASIIRFIMSFRPRRPFSASIVMPSLPGSTTWIGTKRFTTSRSWVK